MLLCNIIHTIRRENPVIQSFARCHDADARPGSRFRAADKTWGASSVQAPRSNGSMRVQAPAAPALRLPGRLDRWSHTHHWPDPPCRHPDFLSMAQRRPLPDAAIPDPKRVRYVPAFSCSRCCGWWPAPRRQTRPRRSYRPSSAALEQLSKLLRSRQAGAASARNSHVPPYTPVPPRRPHPPDDCSLRFVSRSSWPSGAATRRRPDGSRYGRPAHR